MPRTQIINNSQSVITKDISKKIHGIAILMMVIHHTFGFPETMLPGISYMGLTIGSISIEAYIGKMCKLCVAVFAFGTGYGLAYTKLNYSYVCHKIFNLFKIYWFSLALFIVVRLIGGVHHC